MQKKIVLITSSLITLFFLFLVVLGFDSCYENKTCSHLQDVFGGNDWLIITIIAPVVLVFSLITFWMKDEVFKKWFKFTSWYIPILAGIFLFFAVQENSSWGASGSITKGINLLIELFFSAIFVIVSMVKIVRAYKVSKTL
jgi:hypothetical protein